MIHRKFRSHKKPRGYNKKYKCSDHNSKLLYIIADIVYEKGLDVTINFEYKDSDAGDAFIIQAADYVANGLYANYEYKNDIYKNLIKESINVVQYFPYKKFGK